MSDFPDDERIEEGFVDDENEPAVIDDEDAEELDPDEFDVDPTETDDPPL